MESYLERLQAEGYCQALKRLTRHTHCEQLQILVVGAVCAVLKANGRLKLLHPSLLLLTLNIQHTWLVASSIKRLIVHNVVVMSLKQCNLLLKVGPGVWALPLLLYQLLCIVLQLPEVQLASPAHQANAELGDKMHTLG